MANDRCPPAVREYIDVRLCHFVTTEISSEKSEKSEKSDRQVTLNIYG